MRVPFHYNSGTHSLVAEVIVYVEKMQGWSITAELNGIYYLHVALPLYLEALRLMHPAGLNVYVGPDSDRFFEYLKVVRVLGDGGIGGSPWLKKAAI